MPSFKDGFDVNIVNIRQKQSDKSLAQTILHGLSPSNGTSKSMPTLILYDERGLKLFEHITYLDEYYLTNAEIETLEAHADSLVQRIPAGARLVELGSGNLRKIDILFQAFERAQKSVEYFALDLSLSELSRSFSEIATAKYRYVAFCGLHGTYDDGLAWLSRPENKTKPTCILTLGSSLGNFSRTEAAAFLSSFAAALGPSSSVIVGLDACQDPKRVHQAYNDSKGITEWFYRNGLDHANVLLGHQIFKQEEWSIKGVYDETDNKHEAFYLAKRDVNFGKISIKKGEILKLEDAYKYSEQQRDDLWREAGLIPQVSFGNHDGTYHVHLLSPAKIAFPTEASEYATAPTPSEREWHQLWTAWDVVTRSMVPRDELLNKPIKLRNNLIFYLGHIPTFADIHMTKATGGKPTEPASYTSIFERGIDPDVDDPTLCHTHSEIPDEWPNLQDILEYQTHVRDRVISLLKPAVRYPKIARGLWLAFEHEAMHLETFLYMLLQSEKVLPPPGVPTPDFKAMALQAKMQRVPNEWHTIPEGEIRIGIDDPENDLGPKRYFGWDNERPSRVVKVESFEAQGRPISVGEYAAFLEMTKATSMPVSWTSLKHSLGLNAMNGTSKKVLAREALRTVFGPVPLEYVLDWPVMASYNELNDYAKWAHGRIPTLGEARSIYRYAEIQKQEIVGVSSKLISAVNGHLCNNGVEETPPSPPLSNFGEDDVTTSQDIDGKMGSPDPKSLFIDLEGCNIGFDRWHPVPITHLGRQLAGQSGTGGLWEWTSSPLASFPGFKAMDLYPGYTADFFDGKHNICLGGSWASVPRIAGRKSFVNWYQRNYPYVWCTARLVRDIKNNFQHEHGRSR